MCHMCGRVYKSMMSVLPDELKDNFEKMAELFIDTVRCCRAKETISSIVHIITRLCTFISLYHRQYEKSIVFGKVGFSLAA